MKEQSSAAAVSYRPKLHFAAKQHWINDPNGLVYIDGIYHLFYQCNPFGTEWGNMSWGHATSSDLIHWQEQPIAIPQRELKGITESIFSGCCVLDQHNVSGLGSKEQPPLLAFYTSHYSQAPEGMGRQAQSLAYSLDQGMTWAFYSDQPLIALSPGNSEGYNANEFRDPKVFYHDTSGYWVMVLVLAIDRKVIFYRSRNLLDWEPTSTFSDPGDNPQDLWEVPDLVRMPVADCDEVRWVLLLSVNTHGLHEDAGSTQHYFIGDFDGKNFHLKASETPQVRDGRHPGFNRLDWGRDYYAAVTFHNAPGSDPLVMAWMNNWRYANALPSQGFRGQMTLARRLKLQFNGEQMVLCSSPVLPDLPQASVQMTEARLGSGRVMSMPVQPMPLCLQLTIEAHQQGQLCMSLWYGDKAVRITLDAGHQSASLDRNALSGVQLPESFSATDTAQPAHPIGGKVLLLLDNASIEVFSVDAGWSITQQLFPVAPLERVTIEYHDEQDSDQTLEVLLEQWPMLA